MFRVYKLLILLLACSWTHSFGHLKNETVNFPSNQNSTSITCSRAVSNSSNSNSTEAGDCAFPIPPQQPPTRKALTKRELSQVAQWVDFNLAFPTLSNAYNRYHPCGTNTKCDHKYATTSQFALVCDRNDEKNWTDTGGSARAADIIPFMGYLTTCVRSGYYPRTLSASQISWKSENETNKTDIQSSLADLAARLNSSLINVTDASDPLVKATAMALAKAAAEAAAQAARVNGTGQIIQEYLAFAILLPNHPFSSDLYRSLSIVAPIFPSVTVVVGNGYEFKEMCAQYNVRSFPKLLFFKKGILVGRYKKAYEPGLLASQFAKWTNSYPQALPILRMSSLSSSPSNFTKKSESKFSKIFSFMKLDSWVSPPIEPIVGSIEGLVEWDGLIFLLSGIYTLIRLVSFLRTVDGLLTWENAIFLVTGLCILLRLFTFLQK